MKRIWLLVILALALAGCDGPQRTVDRLKDEIAAYKTYPSEAAQARIEADFTKLDAQILDLREKNRTAEAGGYRAAADNLRSDYRAARMVNAVKDAQTAIQGLGNAFKDAGQSIGDAFRSQDPTPTPRQP